MARERSAKRIRVTLVGFGTVGRWLAGAVSAGSRRLAARYGVEFSFVGLANSRDGFVYDPAGLDIVRTLRPLADGRPSLASLDGERWPTALEGLRSTDADVLVEASASPAGDGEPGATHMRESLDRRMAVVTSNKWPVALRGVELAALADEFGVPFRAESTVMSGTPVLSSLREGLAGAVPVALRGVLNATVNFVLTAMAAGDSYDSALQKAQRLGLAERDPAADVEGHDSAAKLMILSALVFGRQLDPDQVSRRGIAELTSAEIAGGAENGRRIREVATLESTGRDGDGGVAARVGPELLPADDPLARIDGTTNAVACEVEPVGEVTVIGPGAGLDLAGQGVLSDLIAAGRSIVPSRPRA